MATANLPAAFFRRQFRRIGAATWKKFSMTALA